VNKKVCVIFLVFKRSIPLLVVVFTYTKKKKHKIKGEKNKGKVKGYNIGLRQGFEKDYKPLILFYTFSLGGKFIVL